DALWTHCSTKLHYLVRQHPFGRARLQDEDIELDFTQLAHPGDCVAVIATEPLTLNEPWVAMQSGQLLAFKGGQPVAV
ncbi:MAG: class II glutamine amidotransferase, partial [Aquabacterium sp.]|nr:class II glutamine amidotransferase [Aquabacterium sp.]